MTEQDRKYQVQLPPDWGYATLSSKYTSLLRAYERLHDSTRRLWLLNTLLVLALLAVAICFAVYAHKEMAVVSNMEGVINQIVEHINGGAG